MNRIVTFALPLVLVAGCSTFKEDPRSTSTELPAYAQPDPVIETNYSGATETYNAAEAAYQALPGSAGPQDTALYTDPVPAPAAVQPVAAPVAASVLPESYYAQSTPLAPAPVETAALSVEPAPALAAPAPAPAAGASGIDVDSGTVSWPDAVTLIKAGEVENFTDVGGGEILLDLCSGRAVLTTAPAPGAIFGVTPPQTVCGQEAPMISTFPQG